jgi:hypothetical protein
MKKHWHIIRTAIFYLIGLMNTAFIKTENIGSWENYLGYAILILAVIDTIVIIKKYFWKKKKEN